LPTEDTQGKQQIHYDSHWILKKIQLRQTVHFICYHEESKTFAVVTSTSEPTNKLMQLGGEDKELEMFERDENFILPHKSQFYLQLYTPNTWEQLPLGKYTLAEWEHVSSLKLVNLPYEGHSSGFRTYLAASTVNCYNEDVNSRGRIILFDIIEAVPEPDKPLTSIKMKVVFEKEQKGPVSCLESVNGYLIGGVGQKVSASFLR
jgi:cleavage and polyadenylation specificity factor subunit 1